jgi:hypothetical protein
MATSEVLLRRRARRRVKAMKGFFIHLSAYLLVNGFLIADRLLASPPDLSVLWITGGWGIGLAAHAFGVYGPPFRVHLLRDWEERKVNELVDREKSKRRDLE